MKFICNKCGGNIKIIKKSRMTRYKYLTQSATAICNKCGWKPVEDTDNRPDLIKSLKELKLKSITKWGKNGN